MAKTVVTSDVFSELATRNSDVIKIYADMFTLGEVENLELKIIREVASCYALDVPKTTWNGFIGKRSAKKMFSNVISEVNSFLDVDDVPLPKINYASANFKPRDIAFLAGGVALSVANYFLTEPESLLQYALLVPSLVGVGAGTIGLMSSLLFGNAHRSTIAKDSVSTLLIAKDNAYATTLAFAHEYTHAITKHCSPKRNYVKSPLIEGTAREIERVIAKSYAEKENDSGYLHLVKRQDVAEMLSVYDWVCKLHSRTPFDFASEQKYFSSDGERAHMKKYGFPTAHAIGNSIYLLQDSNESLVFNKETGVFN